MRRAVLRSKSFMPPNIERAATRQFCIGTVGTQLERTIEKPAKAAIFQGPLVIHLITLSHLACQVSSVARSAFFRFCCFSLTQFSWFCFLRRNEREAVQESTHTKWRAQEAPAPPSSTGRRRGQRGEEANTSGQRHVSGIMKIRLNVRPTSAARKNGNEQPARTPKDDKKGGAQDHHNK